MLGFGAAEAVTFLTPITLAVVTEVFTFLALEIKKSITAEGSSLINEQIKSMLKKYRPPDKMESDAPLLSSEQLTHIRRLAFEKARQLKLSEAQANLLADSVIGSLTLPKG
jgi:hypothetical protein